VSQSIDVLVAGSVAMDISCDYNGPGTGQPSHHTSNPAHISHSLGGVGQNIATASHYFGAKTQLCTVVGRDPPGKAIVAELQRRGMNTDALVQTRTDSPTAQYIAINDAKKDLVLAMADMRILEENHGAFDGLWKPQLERSKPRWVVVDGNWNPETLREWTAAARTIGAKVAYEPVSVEKSTRLLHEDWKSHLGGLLSTHVGTAQNGAFSRSKIVDMATPNTYEVAAMSAALRSLDAWLMFQESMPKEDLERFVKSQFEHTFSLDVLAAALASVRLVSRIPCILTKLGAEGVLLTEALSASDSRLSDPNLDKHVLCRKASSIKGGSSFNAPFLLPEVEESNTLEHVAGVYMRHYQIPNEIPREAIVSVNGVGDTFLGVLVAGLAQGTFSSIEDGIDYAQRAAALTLQSKDSVSPQVRSLIWE
jgi:pseudouridine-5'-phosphate glycosidase/pseudouridine kinase